MKKVGAIHFHQPSDSLEDPLLGFTDDQSGYLHEEGIIVVGTARAPDAARPAENFGGRPDGEKLMKRQLNSERHGKVGVVHMPTTFASMSPGQCAEKVKCQRERRIRRQRQATGHSRIV